MSNAACACLDPDPADTFPSKIVYDGMYSGYNQAEGLLMLQVPPLALFGMNIDLGQGLMSSLVKYLA